MITHDTPTIEVANLEYRSGRASTTIDESANATATAAATTSASADRRRSPWRLGELRSDVRETRSALRWKFGS